MKKIFPILLIGCLSMFFAEILSGASQTWFLSGWGLLLTFPLYLFHTLFFLWIALKSKKISISHLYIFGVIFGLYESWITKVLWSGYMSSSGPGIGTIFGIGIPEFPILIFFWHPILSFILPILTFEILTQRTFIEHEKILNKTYSKTTLIIISIILISTFIASGNQFNLASANASIIGTLALISGLYLVSKKSHIKDFEFKKSSFIAISIYLTLLYIATFLLLLPQKIPTTIIPYLTITAFYIISILLIRKSKPVEVKLSTPDKNQYSTKNLIIFSIILIIATNLSILLPTISSILLGISYYTMMPIGTIIFLITIFKIIKNKK